MVKYQNNEEQVFQTDVSEEISEVLKKLLDGYVVVTENPTLPRLVGRKLSPLRENGQLEIWRDQKLGKTRMQVNGEVDYEIEKGKIQKKGWFDRKIWKIIFG